MIPLLVLNVIFCLAQTVLIYTLTRFLETAFGWARYEVVAMRALSVIISGFSFLIFAAALIG